MCRWIPRLENDVLRSERLAAAGWEVHDHDAVDGEPRDLELTSAAQLATLTDGFRMRLMTSIRRRPGSAKELAARFDVPTTRLYHHLDLLEEHGFVRVVATRQSGARTERCYGTPPFRSIRPAQSLVDGDDAGAFGAALRAMAEVVGVSLEEAVRKGALRPMMADDEHGRTVVSWSSVRLTPEEQERFAAEFADLVERVATASKANTDADDDTGAESFTSYVVLAPDVVLPE